MKKGYCETCKFLEIGYDWYSGGKYMDCLNPEKKKVPLEEYDDEWGFEKPCPFWEGKEVEE